MITGKDLIEWGMKPGAHFRAALNAANLAAENGDDPKTAALIYEPRPVNTLPLRDAGTIVYRSHLPKDTPEEIANADKVHETMTELLRVPTIIDAEVMADACPAGPVGTIPVGGVVETRGALHPGFHSADICCSVMMTRIGNINPRKVLDAAMERSHFGGGGRDKRLPPPSAILSRFADNRFLRGLEDIGHHHFGTQGDGNHFFFVGRDSAGTTTIVTHHGSRKLGAMVYKRGLAAAQEFTRKVSPETPAASAWLNSDNDDGRDYWIALNIVADWTAANHEVIHDLVIDAVGGKAFSRAWNAHNFIFRNDYGRFYHAKGATSLQTFGVNKRFDGGERMIPLNMAAPVLVLAPSYRSTGASSFAPHGAGRNTGRGAHIRSLGEVDIMEQFRAETKGLDVRFWTGHPDLSELPSAYKSASKIKKSIVDRIRARITDEIEPVGSIMAGNWMQARK